MIWIDVTARAARQVRAMTTGHPEGQRPGLRVAVDREAADGAVPDGGGPGDDGPPVRLSLATGREAADLVLPRSGFDVLVDGGDAAEVDGLRIDFLHTPDGSGFVIDRVPRQRIGAPPVPQQSAPVPAPDDELVLPRVRAALDGVRPALRADGGDVELVSVAAGVAYVRLQGACSGCSAALLTLTALIEQAVTDAVPEVSRAVLVA